MGVMPHASFGVRVCGTSGRGFVGNGWVGEVSDCGSALFGADVPGARLLRLVFVLLLQFLL